MLWLSMMHAGMFAHAGGAKGARLCEVGEVASQADTYQHLIPSSPALP